MNDQTYDVKEMLADLATDVDWPDDGDLTGRIRSRLAVPVSRRSGRRLLRATLAILSAVVLIAAVLLIPAGREAVAELLGVAGIEIELTEDASSDLGSDLDLGRPVSLREALDIVDFVVIVPDDEIGAPGGAYIDDENRVTLVWGGGNPLPAAGDTEVGLLHTQFRSDDGATLLVKKVGPGTQIETVAVGDAPGFWIEGEPHVLRYLDGDGAVREESTRLAAHVLLWEADGVTHRIETTVSLEETLPIAESLRPVSY
ncbi:MAG: hypothetical protein GEU79_04825 [Acidimicrobiia bacterium]|nr:hypothetical protein [Acidimicrobiia bacterium]